MNKKRRGFTLIELIIVIVIIGILALVGIPRYFANIQNAKKSEAVTTMRAIRDAETARFARYGAYVDVAAAGWPLEVDIDVDGTNDISVNPVSTNFTYTVAGNVISATKVAGKSDNTYTMTLDTGVVTTS